MTHGQIKQHVCTLRHKGAGFLSLQVRRVLHSHDVRSKAVTTARHDTTGVGPDSLGRCGDRRHVLAAWYLETVG